MKIDSSVLQFIVDSWKSHMIVLIVTGILLAIPDSWFIWSGGASIPAIWKSVILIIFLLSFVLTLVDIITYFGKSSKKINIKNYDIDQENEWFSHKKRGGKLCPKCLSNPEGKEVPLIVDRAGWNCPVCGETRITMKGPERFPTLYRP